MDITKIPFEAYTGEQPYVFVSYAHKDSETVYPLMEKLHWAIDFGMTRE